MRPHFPFIASLLVSACVLVPAASADEQTSFSIPVDGLACFENFSRPEYPAAALEKNIDGFVWATVKVGPQGIPSSIETEVISAFSEAKDLLAAPVEKALRAAKVKPECSGKTVSVDFHYVLPQDSAGIAPGESSYLVPILSQPVAEKKSAPTPRSGGE